MTPMLLSFLLFEFMADLSSSKPRRETSSWSRANSQPPGPIRLVANFEGVWRSRSASARDPRFGERESWRSACRTCAWQGLGTKAKTPEARTCRGLMPEGERLPIASKGGSQVAKIAWVNRDAMCMG
jgi:hypothetical protein